MKLIYCTSLQKMGEPQNAGKKKNRKSTENFISARLIFFKNFSFRMAFHLIINQFRLNSVGLNVNSRFLCLHTRASENVFFQHQIAGRRVDGKSVTAVFCAVIFDGVCIPFPRLSTVSFPEPISFTFDFIRTGAVIS